MHAVVSSETPTVLVNFGCNPVDLAFALAHDGIPAILDAYYPQLFAGRAVAEVLAGIFPPAGRLPFSWPRTLDDAGDLGNYTMAGTSKTYRYRLPNKTAPLFPFGYGLAYTTFTYSDLSVHPSVVTPCDNVSVSVQVRNDGAVDSDEVVQVYLSWEHPPFATPAIQLVGFERVHIKAGHSVSVTITIHPEQMALLDDTHATGRFSPFGPNPRNVFRPCDGNTTNHTCGYMTTTKFLSPQTGSGSRGKNQPMNCCESCRQAGPDRCVGWTYHPQGRWCDFHTDISNFTQAPDIHTTSGIVWEHFDNKTISCDAVLPTWTLVPGSMRMWVGGQQPNQDTTSPSNVLSGSFSISGSKHTPLVSCTK